VDAHPGRPGPVGSEGELTARGRSMPHDEYGLPLVTLPPGEREVRLLEIQARFYGPGQRGMDRLADLITGINANLPAEERERRRLLFTDRPRGPGKVKVAHD